MTCFEVFTQNLSKLSFKCFHCTLCEVHQISQICLLLPTSQYHTAIRFAIFDHLHNALLFKEFSKQHGFNVSLHQCRVKKRHNHIERDAVTYTTSM